MLHIILGILKIIGIILLVIIAIILLIILLLLCFPVGYQAKGEKYKADISANGKIYWLFHLFAFHISYKNKELKMGLRILGIPVNFKKKSHNKDKKVKKNKKVNKDKSLTIEKENKNEKTSEDLNEQIVEETCEKTSEETNGQAVDEKIKKDTVDLIENTDKRKSNKKKSTVKSFFQKIRLRFRSIFSTIKNIKFTFENIYDKIILAKEKASQIIRFLKDENNKVGFKLIKKQLWVLWKHIKPKKLQLECRFGTGDPATTGQILGGISVVYPIFQNHFKITPDFEEEVFDGKLALKGRVQLGIFVRIAFVLYRNKNIKEMINQLQTIRRK